jgi:hypothetical protein
MVRRELINSPDFNGGSIKQPPETGRSESQAYADSHLAKREWTPSASLSLGTRYPSPLPLLSRNRRLVPSRGTGGLFIQQTPRCPDDRLHLAFATNSAVVEFIAPFVGSPRVPATGLTIVGFTVTIIHSLPARPIRRDKRRDKRDRDARSSLGSVECETR